MADESSEDLLGHEYNICDEDQSSPISPIHYLPNEIITMILLNNCTLDILNFGATCRRFNNLVKTDPILWKIIFQSVQPQNIVDIVEKRCNGNWQRETKRYYTVKGQIISEIKSMSPKFYWRRNDIGMADVRNYFSTALFHNMTYYYTVTTLQTIIRCGLSFMKDFNNDETQEKSVKKFNLTDVYYARMVLRYLMHTFLCTKWVKMHIHDELTPLSVITFFLQWADIDNLYCEDMLQNEIKGLVSDVENVINTSRPDNTNKSIKERLANGKLKEFDILRAISEVLYRQRLLTATDSAQLVYLDPLKVLSWRKGHKITLAIIYDALCKHFGVDCELVAFPNHMFLEWRDKSNGPVPAVYTLDFNSGEFKPKRRCPFSQGNPSALYKYNPDSLLQYIYLAYVSNDANDESEMNHRDWNYDNVCVLLDFLGREKVDNQYRNFLPFLLDQDHEGIDFRIQYLSFTQMEMINKLANLNDPVPDIYRERTVKVRQSHVKYAVGMICQHKTMHYTCVIRGWDIVCNPEFSKSNNRVTLPGLEFGTAQPFYYVVVLDQTERYVAQEHLIMLNLTEHEFDLMYIIWRDFAHFDGFCYVPNKEKELEYPGDYAVSQAYKARMYVRGGVVLLKSLSP